MASFSITWLKIEKGLIIYKRPPLSDDYKMEYLPGNPAKCSYK